MNKKPIKILKEIEKDCLQLKKEGQLTEYGEGQLHLIKIIKPYLK
jgi:hypothetical protein